MEVQSPEYVNEVLYVTEYFTLNYLIFFFFYQGYQTIYLLALKKRKISSILYEKMYETDVTLIT